MHIHFQRMPGAARPRMQNASVPPGLDLGFVNPWLWGSTSVFTKKKKKSVCSFQPNCVTVFIYLGVCSFHVL